MNESSDVPAASARAKDPVKAHWAVYLALILAILGVGLSVYTWYVTQVAGQLEAGRELGRLDGVDRELTRLVTEQSGLQVRIDAARLWRARWPRPVRNWGPLRKTGRFEKLRIYYCWQISDSVCLEMRNWQSGR
jgi:hypothetical protein